MKSLKIVSVFILTFFVFTIISCEDEPLEGEFGTDGGQNEITCTQATQNLATASNLYAITATDDASYPVVCNDYATALQNMINACGDETGAIQTLLDGLDCPAISDDCTTAQAATATAATAYNADTTDQNLCLAYTTALENEITQCGDVDGSLQNIIDGLNCTTNAGMLSVTAAFTDGTGEVSTVFNPNSAVLNSGLITVNGSPGTNFSIFFELMENTTGVDILQNFKLTYQGEEYFPNTSLVFDDFTNNITLNSGGNIEGTFSGFVTNAAGTADLILRSGLIDLTY